MKKLQQRNNETQVLNMSNDFKLQPEKVGKDKPTFFCDKPNFELEKGLCLDGNEIIVGVDEAGRGALAGPLALGFVIYDKSFFLEKCNDEILNIDDSKKMTEKKRVNSHCVIEKYSLNGNKKASNHYFWNTSSIAKGMYIISIAHNKTKLVYQIMLSR